MGASASAFRKDDGPSPNLGHPSKADWITAHATESGLAIVEVERLWYRFQQLGCTPEGVLSSYVLTNPPASKDIFMKNILTTFRNPKDPEYNITFLTFLNAMNWAENAETEEKVRATFQLMNNGYPVSKEILSKIVKRLYPKENERNLNKTCDAVMQQMDPNNTGQINEEQFTVRALQLPADSLEPLLAFSIIPEDINAEAHRAFSTNTRQTARSALTTPQSTRNGGSSPLTISKQIPTDNKLRDIAQKVHRRDWQLLANKLGLTSQDVEQIQASVGADSMGQCLEMLKTWRNREGANAYAEVLEKALRESNMNDAAMLLQP